MGVGRIISQSLTSGTVAKGTTISYVVSLGGEPDEEEPSDSSNNNDNNSSDNTNNGGSDPHPETIPDLLHLGWTGLGE